MCKIYFAQNVCFCNQFKLVCLFSQTKKRFDNSISNVTPLDCLRQQIRCTRSHAETYSTFYFYILLLPTEGEEYFAISSQTMTTYPVVACCYNFVCSTSLYNHHYSYSLWSLWFAKIQHLNLKLLLVFLIPLVQAN